MTELTNSEAGEAREPASEPSRDLASARHALALGEPLLAYDICATSLQAFPDHLGLRQTQCLALARSGATEQARQLLERLYDEGLRDEETLGLLARVHKDLWQQSPGSPRGQSHLATSRKLYEQAYRTVGGYWSAVNAATLALVVGDIDASQELAVRARDLCMTALDRGQPRDPWPFATLGETALLLGDQAGARDWYARALQAGAGFGDVASMRRNARLVLLAKKADTAWLEQCLAGPLVGVFAGHMPDLPDASALRFPEALAEPVARALRRRIEDTNVRIGYASAAAGADILFHEAMFALGRETHVVLSESPERFARDSVAPARGKWLERFHYVLQRAASVVVHSPTAAGGIGHTYNNWIVLGLARLRAMQLDGRLRAMSLWDGRAGKAGGTASAIADWQEFGEAVDWLAPTEAEAARPSWRTAPARQSAAVSGRALGTQRIVSMLFADAVGFSRLPDESIPRFVDHFLGTVARVLERQAEAALTRNTWGDGLYFSFATLGAAGRFALDLCETVRATDWIRHGLPADLSLRIALHSGPAHEVLDPVTRQRNYTGAHVSRAARIEPVTPPGNVYASQSFAALCECEGIREFTCEYVGRMPLAKKYGEYPTYCVRRRG